MTKLVKIGHIFALRRHRYIRDLMQSMWVFYNKLLFFCTGVNKTAGLGGTNNNGCVCIDVLAHYTSVTLLLQPGPQIKSS